jgi:predicted DNA-binding transcriptional regulator AlpA
MDKSLPLIVRRPQLKALLGISPTTAARLENDPSSGFPRRRQWSARVCGWSGQELSEWVISRGQLITGRKPLIQKGN